MGQMAQRFLTLDGLRGVAAIIVVCFHMGYVRWMPTPAFGYLAVDIFFALSGFVLAQANDERFADGLTATRFMIRRTIRLFPLYLTVLLPGIALEFRSYLSPQTLKTAGFNLLLLPTPFYTETPAGLFPNDPPAWSLFFEFWIANLFYALFWPLLSRGKLWAIVAVSAVGLIGCQLYFGSLDEGDRWSGAIVGLARVLFSFFAGVLISRSAPDSKLALATPSLLLLAATVALLCMPVTGFATKPYETICVLIFFPSIIWLGAGAIEKRPWLGARLGDMSYALYLFHFPLLITIDRHLRRHGYEPGLLAAFLFLIGVMAVAYMVDRYYDAPLRKWLLAFALRPHETKHRH
jgi:peptidoglycan/LPS O-acetylase OafA/YrhL